MANQNTFRNLLISAIIIWVPVLLFLSFYLPTKDDSFFSNVSENYRDNPEWFGEYIGRDYIFTLDENGVGIEFKNETKFVIFNRNLIIHQFDENGNKLENELVFQFVENDSSYNLITKNDTYTLKKKW